MNRLSFRCMLILACCFQLSFAQDGYELDGSMLADYELIGNPTVQSPDVAAFQKVTQIPVSHYTGRANITIPIYEIKTGNMTVPISITYNTSGVKVSDMPSNVGSNWALNAGGVVTRTVKGIDDYTIPKIIHTPNTHDEMTPAGWTVGWMDEEVSLNQENDPAPDIYHANAPGLSTRYIHENAIANAAITPIEIENNGNDIDESFGHEYTGYIDSDIIQNGPFPIRGFGMHSIDITSIQGIKYSFATPEISFSSSKNSKTTSSNFLDGFNVKFDAYKLDRMYDYATNQAIDFEYEEYVNTFYDNFHTGTNSENFSMRVKTNRLTRILFDGGEVQFIYGLDRQDNLGEKALTEVRVLNHLGETIKRMQFSYGYFQSTIDPDRPQSKRLRLNKVTQVSNTYSIPLPGYVFTYNESIDMPPRDSWAHDFLGYNNGSYAAAQQGKTPKIYFDRSAYQSNYILADTMTKQIQPVGTPFYSSGDLLLGGTYSLEANETQSKAYILTKIQYPTGGFAEFEYESNDFSSGTRKGGGLRIKSQKLVDEYGIEQIEEYSYENGYINQMPQYATFELQRKDTSVNYNATDPDDLGVAYDLYNVPQTQVELTHGAFVGYANITVTNRYNNQQTKYYYKNASHHPNVASTKTIFGFNSDLLIGGRSWRALGHYSLSLDRDILRGKLARKEIIDHNGDYVLTEEYTYRLKEFETLSFSFQNPTRSILNGTYTCYSDFGLYNRHCGGYDETIEFPIERNLITQIKTRTYPEIHSGNVYETEKRYWYDAELPRKISEQQGMFLCDYEEEYEWPQHTAEEYVCNNSGLEYIKKEYTYQNTYPFRYRLLTPKSVVFSNEKGLLQSENYVYKDFGNAITDLEKVEYITRDEDTDTPVIVTRRDAKGNILETRSETGIYTSFVFGYGSRYMVCQLVNVSYTDLLAAFAGLTSSVTQLTNATTDDQIKTITSQLRDRLPDGQVTSYTYTPLVGVTSITDVRGRETSYIYDNYNRLHLVKDHDQHIVSKNTYTYKR